MKTVSRSAGGFDPPEWPTLEWCRQRLKRDASVITGFVWGEQRPRGDFKGGRHGERAWAAWNANQSGQMAGSVEGRGPKLRTVNPETGKTHCIDMRGLAIAFNTGEWPRGKLPPWKPPEGMSGGV